MQQFFTSHSLVADMCVSRSDYNQQLRLCILNSALFINPVLAPTCEMMSCRQPPSSTALILHHYLLGNSAGCVVTPVLVHTQHIHMHTVRGPQMSLKSLKRLQGLISLL
jgi:hypothetical protein